MAAAWSRRRPRRSPRARQHGRNYDYRYVWIRDQCYVGQAVARSGPHPAARRRRPLRPRPAARGRPRLTPAYTTSGGRVPDERAARPARLSRAAATSSGNWVNQQFQLDAFGEALLLFAAAAGHDRLDADGWRAVEVAAEAIEARWREPDAGIWELEPDEWTHSRLICAAGLRAIAGSGPGPASAQPTGSPSPTRSSRTPRRAHSSDPAAGSARPSDDRVDARSCCRRSAARSRPTIRARSPRSRAVEAELTEDGYAYRYRHDARPLGEAEGAFLLCGFFLRWPTRSRAIEVAAARWFERNRAACGPPGLLSEEFDVAAAPAARQPAAGVRPRAAPGVRRRTARRRMTDAPG